MRDNFRRDLFTTTECNHCGKKIICDHEAGDPSIWSKLEEHYEDDLDCRIIRVREGIMDFEQYQNSN